MSVKDRPPKVPYHAMEEIDRYARKASSVVIRHSPELLLTLASYVGGYSFEADVEPTAVGKPPLNMPLFLEPDAYVTAPLERTYESAWESVPQVWRNTMDKKSR